MDDPKFDLDAYLLRIGIERRLDPTLETLSVVVGAHCATFPYENIDVLLGRPPKLDLETLQAKMVRGQRGGYCFEQNALLRAALRALGFAATGLLARVVRGSSADAPAGACHMVVRVDLEEGPFLADAGFGNLTPTSPLALRPLVEQQTPHETMRLMTVGPELVLQAKIGETWENLWRLCSQTVVDVDYDVANWFTATHPASLFLSNMIAARPGPGRTRRTFFNGRLNVRLPDGSVERTDLTGEDNVAAALADSFGLVLSPEDLRSALAAIERLSRRGETHPIFN